MSELRDKVILITGATSGIGRATALYFSVLGAKVVAAARTPSVGTELVAELTSKGAEARFIATDVTNDEQVRNMDDYAVSEFGRLDFAFNNAGIFAPETRLHEHEDDTWNSVISSNLKSIYTCMKYEIDAMLSLTSDDTQPRVIVNNASMVGHRGSSASGVAYTTAKHGIIGLTRQVAVDYAGDNIRVNAVSPGPTLTAATRPRLDAPQEEVNARLAALNPTGELVAVEHIAETVAFLCSPAAQMINGHDIPLDGGQLAKL
jgi:NAD(P)-dependent dehydrogenase (short-subunit alcohol dehydrogenase family)